MAKQLKKILKPEQPQLVAPALPRKKHKAKKRPAGAKQKPLPPPVEPATANRDPMGIAAAFNQEPQASARPSGNSSTSDPKPGQPLDPERERVLREGFEEIGVEENEPEAGGQPAGVKEGQVVADMLPSITFDPQDVEDALTEGFDWLAEKFDSAHWKLTEKQARMLGRPTAQVLTTLYARLPDFLLRWCDSTPGLAAMCVTGTIVIGPKVAQQVAISRERRKEQKPAPAPRPYEVPRRTTGGPVGAIPDVEPIAE